MLGFFEYVLRHQTWSWERFGPAPTADFGPVEYEGQHGRIDTRADMRDNRRTKGITDHIRKELAEIEKDPADYDEWLDVIILAIDGYWRHGGDPSNLLPSLYWKQGKNMRRVHPDWRTMPTDKAIEHDRSVKTD